MEQHFDFLLGLPLFEGLNKDELAHLLRCANARVETVRETSLFWQQPASAFETLKRDQLPYLLKRVETASVMSVVRRHESYLNIIMEGQIRIFHEDWLGKRVQLGKMTKGLFFNDYVLCQTGERLPYLCEIQGGTKLLLLENTKLLQPCAKSCPFHWQHLRNVLMGLLGHQVGMFLKINCLSQRTTREKLTAFLTFYADMEGSHKFTLHMTRQELADELSVDRTGVSKELSLMQKEGLIRYNRNEIELLK